MKIILLIISFLFLGRRIKQTPRDFNNNLYLEEINRMIETMNKYRLEHTEDEYSFYMKHLKTISLTGIVFLTLYYIVIACTFNSLVVAVLSVVQIGLTLYNIKLLKCVGSVNAEDYNVPKAVRIFNPIVDYIYYPIIIFLLIVSISFSAFLM